MKSNILLLDLDNKLPKPPFPPIPTREEVLGINMHFRGGLIVGSPTFGKMPWWPSALSWCDVITRNLVYDAMRAAGDTHAIINIPSGGYLYPEPNQFYTIDKFGYLDWTNGETQLDGRFTNLVDEVIEAGFKYIIAMDERPIHSQKIVQLVMSTLSDKQLSYGLTIPGYDGVFYGWEASDITRWATLARAIKPNCYLGMEHNPGHIPLGKGPADYAFGGGMDGFDVILGEFSADIHNGNTWQILGRMIRPYHRPPDQVGDSPNPPFYLTDSPRGPRYYCAFESFYPYNWVRTNVNDPLSLQRSLNGIKAETDYFKLCGCKWIG